MDENERNEEILENEVTKKVDDATKEAIAEEISENGTVLEEEVPQTEEEQNKTPGKPIIRGALGLVPPLGFALGQAQLGEALGNGDILKALSDNAPQIAAAMGLTGEKVIRNVANRIGGIAQKVKENREENKSDTQEVKQSSAQINTDNVRQASDNNDKSVVSEIINNTEVNENGKVVGIDISEDLSPEELRKQLTSDGIPTELYDKDGVMHVTNDLNHKIGYVMIKIGARGYGSEGNLVDMGGSYLEQAKVCEELGVPYGFYYYSTALTKEEAQEEVNQVKERMDEIGDKKYNLLPLTLDVEQCEGSRIEGVDVTDVAAHWANVAEDATGQKVLLYTGGRDVIGEEKILDINRFNSQIKSGPAKIWTPGPRTPDGTRVYGANQNQINGIVSEGGNIAMIQTILDQKNDEVGWALTDANIMDKDEFDKMVREGAGLEKVNNFVDIVQNFVNQKKEEQQKTVQQEEQQPEEVVQQEEQQTPQPEEVVQQETPKEEQETTTEEAPKQEESIQSEENNNEQQKNEEKKGKSGFFGWLTNTFNRFFSNKKRLNPGEPNEQKGIGGPIREAGMTSNSQITKEGQDFRKSLEVDVSKVEESAQKTGEEHEVHKGPLKGEDIERG